MKIAKIVGCILFISGYIFCEPDKQPITKYCHGLDSSPARGEQLEQADIIEKPSDSFRFDDTKRDIGQEHDIATLQQQIDPDKKYLLHGHSRGGSTILNFLGKHNPCNIVGAVLDAAPADMIDRVDEIQCEIGLWIFNSRAAKEWILRKIYPGYTQGGIPPVQAIKSIQDKSLPIFLVHSENDKIVNIRAAWKNYKALKEAKFPNVYLCSLKKSAHSYNGLGKDQQDNNIYKTAVHSFYKKHDFKHDSKLATLDDLSRLQPSIEETEAQIQAQETKLLEKYYQRRTRNLCIGGIGITLGLAAAIIYRK